MTAAEKTACARSRKAPRFPARPDRAFLCSAPVLLLLFILTAALLSSCAVRSPYPDPGEFFFVYDGAGVISGETERYIVASNADLERKTGAQIVVAAVETTGFTDIADYAKGLFNKWEIGDSAKNNGVLLLISAEEDDYWVVQGSGLEDLLSSGTLKLMLDEYMEPEFARGNYDGAARSMFGALVSFFESAYSVTVEPDYSYEPSAAETQAVPVPEKNSGCRSSGLGTLFLILSLGALALTAAGIAVLISLASKHGRDGTSANAPGPVRENRNPYSQTYKGPREGYTPSSPDPAQYGKNPYTGHTGGLNPAGGHRYTTSGGTVYTGSNSSGGRSSVAADAAQHGFHADVNPYLEEMLTAFAGSALRAIVRGAVSSGLFESGKTGTGGNGTSGKTSSAPRASGSGSFSSGTFSGSTRPRSPGNIHVGGWNVSSGGSSHTVRSNRSHSGFSGAFRSSGGSHSYSSGGSRSFSGGGGRTRGGGAGRR